MVKGQILVYVGCSGVEGCCIGGYLIICSCTATNEFPLTYIGGWIALKREGSRDLELRCLWYNEYYLDDQSSNPALGCM